MSELDISQLKKRADSPKDASEKGSAILEFLNRDISLSGGGINDRVREKFYHEFHILLSAGIDFRTSMDILVQEYKQRKTATVFRQLQQSVVKGVSLSEAMRQSGRFSPFEYNSVAIGEETGKLQESLRELAAYYAQRVKQRRQITGALTYPAIVVTVAIGAIIFMMNFLVPMFEDIFKRFGGNLPRLTQIIIGLSDWLGANLKFVALGLAVFIAFTYSQRKRTYFRRYGSALVLRIPFFGRLVQKIRLAQFTNSMQLLINSSIPLVEALELTSKMTGYYPIEKALLQIRQEIVRGASLHQSMAQHRIFPSKLISVIKVAEETNTLGLSFQRITRQYQEEAQHQTSVINTAIEPVIIVLLGLVVAIILIAMYLPLFQVNNLMNV